ncbi:hypothetical protein EIKCOROL_01887 [Eikenella corrodens ATCC 23834]|uniref:Uncharacterized protein n=1 Tax=Eikenella corrodens ATCC 23834 TaxID=546274 RepID=C0DWY3_EIKCO|nr:hypothetical protein EIKCOROL_01887 [Eikenella corrodens ATCC 23834]
MAGIDIKQNMHFLPQPIGMAFKAGEIAVEGKLADARLVQHHRRQIMLQLGLQGGRIRVFCQDFQQHKARHGKVSVFTLRPHAQAVDAVGAQGKAVVFGDGAFYQPFEPHGLSVALAVGIDIGGTMAAGRPQHIAPALARTTAATAISKHQDFLLLRLIELIEGLLLLADTFFVTHHLVS